MFGNFTSSHLEALYRNTSTSITYLVSLIDNYINQHLKPFLNKQLII